MNTIEALKALINNQTFRKNVAQVAMVAVAAITGAIIANKIDTGSQIVTIDESSTTEVI